VNPGPSVERYVVSPRAPFLAATAAVVLVVLAMIGLATITSGAGSILCLAVAAVAVAVAVGRLRARVTVSPDAVDIRTGWGATVVPRRPVPVVAVSKQSLGWTPVLRVPGGTDVLVLPLAGWSQGGAAKAAAELSAALDAVPARRR
jgi:membrane protein YdbS with pleckstrin-like domain